MSTIASTIASQIGNRAFAMMGAKNLVAGDKSLTFKVGTNAKKVTHIVVELEPSDTYTVRFVRVSRGGAVVSNVSQDVYADSLHTVIQNHTGLYLSL